MGEDRSKEELAAEINRLQRLQGEIRRLSAAKFIELDSLAAPFSWLDEQRHLRGTGCLIGPSQTGKSIACRVYSLRNRHRRGQRGAIAVVHLRLPPSCGVRTLYDRLLEALNCPTVATTSADGQRQGALTAIADRRVRLLIADNAAAQSPRLLRELRHVSEVGNIAVILVGTPKLTAVLAKDSELQIPFQPRCRLEPLRGDAFAESVERWETDVLQLPDPSNLCNPDGLAALAHACDGRVGHLDRILRRAAIRCLRQGLRSIDRDTLDAIVRDYYSACD